MEIVEPIRDLKKIFAIKNFLRTQLRYRDYLLFTFGINSTLRIGDLLSLKVKDVLNRKGEINNYIFLREKKTKKEKRVKLNRAIKEALDFYFSNVPPTDLEQYLFVSRSGRKLDRVRVWQMINNWIRKIGLKGRYGTHTLRKTWGYMAWKNQGISLKIIKEKLGHRSVKITKRYICITKEESKEIEDRICL